MLIRMLDALKQWLQRRKTDVEEIASGEVPVATPEGDAESETSTNAQVEGASGQPWPGRESET
jgi:hypothetical protein